jgi:hypothetical protein
MATTNKLQDQLPTGMSDASGDLATATAAVNVLNQFVQATSSLIDKVSDLLPNETRSVIVEIDNVTPFTMTKTGDNFGSGGFGQTLPRIPLPPFSSDVFSAESNGLATGVSGSINYAVEGIGKFMIGFDNPFIGSNAVNVTADATVDAVMQILGEKSNGNHNHARFAILEKGASLPKGQAGWRACSKCQGLFFGAFGGTCPAEGAHDPTKSFDYLMIFDSAASSHIQTGWRACPKCQGMYFGGFPTKGKCPKGGEHTETNSFQYALMFALDPIDGVQLEWKSCNKCQGLFFGPLGGKCPGGGAHDAVNSFNYGLRFHP